MLAMVAMVLLLLAGCLCVGVLIGPPGPLPLVLRGFCATGVGRQGGPTAHAATCLSQEHRRLRSDIETGVALRPQFSDGPPGSYSWSSCDRPRTCLTQRSRRLLFDPKIGVARRLPVSGRSPCLVELA